MDNDGRVKTSESPSILVLNVQLFGRGIDREAL